MHSSFLFIIFFVVLDLTTTYFPSCSYHKLLNKLLHYLVPENLQYSRSRHNKAKSVLSKMRAVFAQIGLAGSLRDDDGNGNDNAINQ